MKRYKVWIECEDEIEAKSLDEALEKFSKQKLNLELNGVEIK
jgi:hypothetical protein